jgi:hypothetical protein
MFARHEFFASVYKICWTILLAAYVAFGCRGVWPELHRETILSPGRYSSTDAYFSALLNIPGGSERWAAVQEKLPKDKSVVFLCPEGNPHCDFVSKLFSYLSWPRDVKMYDINQKNLGSRLATLDRPSTAAVVFFDISPPPGYTRGWLMGKRLMIVPLQEAQ